MRRRNKLGQKNRCASGKVRYRDKLEAMVALSNAQRSDSDRRRECRWYECEVPGCNGFHLTSQPEKEE